MSTRKQIENYCKKNKLIELRSDNLGGDKYYLNTKKILLSNFHYFLKIQHLLKLQQDLK